MSDVRWVLLNGALLLLIAVSIVGVELWDRPESAIEASVRRYATAIGNSDLGAAMAEIAPDQRPEWNDWVNGQLGNVYAVTGVAVRAPWLLGSPTDVTADLDINPGDPIAFYQASPRVAVEQVDGRWYLSAPLLAQQ